jgi:hypothetical protein
MSGWAKAHGAVGLYRIVPMWMAMYMNDGDWSMVLLDSSHVRGSVAEADSSDGEAPYAGIEIHRARHAEWEAYAELYEFLLKSQGSQDMRNGIHELFPHCTLFLLVTGGVLLASAVVDDRNADQWTIRLLRSAAEIGADRALVRYLQSTAPGDVCLHCRVEDSTPFRAMGFSVVGPQLRQATPRWRCLVANGAGRPFRNPRGRWW